MSGQEIRRALHLGDFLAHPRGAAFVGRTFIFYNLDWVRGFRVWGQSGLEETRQVAACIAAAIAHAPATKRYYSLVDLRAVESIPAECFDVFLEFLKSKREQSGSQVVRQALVRPSGLIEAICLGFYQLARPAHQVRHFDSLDAAAGWLDPPDRGELDGLIATLEAGTPSRTLLAPDLRRWLAEHLQDPSPSSAARALGVSVRTMQRRLHSEATSFHTLLRLARVEAAQRLLVSSQLKIAAIALEVGFQSSQQLATSFREVTSSTPSEFRARQREKLGALNVPGA